MNRILRIVLIVSTCSLAACDFGSSHSDLVSYIGEVKRRPSGSIDPLPSFRPYEAFIYSATSMRSPFDLPVAVKRREYARSDPNVKPNFNREKEYLEGFDLNALTMVGTITKAGVLWALVSDDSGGIHRVTDGNYIGRNHGRIISTTEASIELTEIVSDGLDGWVERPRVIALSEKE